MKKKWQKPELVVLYRGKPEENLLAQLYCKGGAAGRQQPDNASGIICQFEKGSRAGDPCYDYALS